MNTFHNMWRSQTEFLNPNKEKDFLWGKHDTAESTNYIIYQCFINRKPNIWAKRKGTGHCHYTFPKSHSDLQADQT